MNELLDRYGKLLGEVDLWFQKCLELHPELIGCHKGCSECCRGLFDITLLDAFFLKRGFDLLPDAVKSRIVKASFLRLKQLSHINPAVTAPWILNIIAEEEWDELMPEADETPCLLLAENGCCLVYEHRPMTCRLNGIPLIDVSGEELFDDWCTMNFINEDPTELDDIRFEFKELFTQELLLFHEFMLLLSGKKRNEVDLFIPAAIVLERNKIVAALAKLDC